MSLANLLVDNNYNVHLPNQKKTLFKALLSAGFSQNVTGATVTFGSSGSGSAQYFGYVNIGGFQINSVDGGIIPPQSGLYNVILRVTYKDNGSSTTSENLLFTRVSDNAIITEFSNIYNNVASGSVIQRQTTALVNLSEGVEYVFKHYMNSSVIGEYYGSSSIDYTSITLEYVSEI